MPCALRRGVAALSGDWNRSRRPRDLRRLANLRWFGGAIGKSIVCAKRGLVYSSITPLTHAMSKSEL